MKIQPEAALLLGGILIGPCAFAEPEVIKLACSLDITVHPPYGASTNSHENVTVEVQSEKSTGFRAITIHSSTIPVAVANSKGGAITSFKDNSDENHWEIWNDRLISQTKMQEMAGIDRNTGLLTDLFVTTVSSVSERTEATGSCNKVDTGKQKF